MMQPAVLPPLRNAAAQDAPPPAVIQNIQVVGNERTETQTILSYLDLQSGGGFSQQDIDRALKNLYATGFFADVRIGQQNNDLVVQVVENPVVNRVAFEGNKKMEVKDLEKEIELKSRAIYTRTRVQNDVKRLLDIYRRSGRYSATVEPKVIQLDQNRVDVVFENIGDPDLFPKAFLSLGRQGRLVTAGGHGGGIVPLDTNRLYLNQITIIGSTHQAPEDIGLSLTAAAEGRLHVIVDRILPLSQAVLAHHIVAGRGGTGKIVLQPKAGT